MPLVNRFLPQDPIYLSEFVLSENHQSIECQQWPSGIDVMTELSFEQCGGICTVRVEHPTSWMKISVNKRTIEDFCIRVPEWGKFPQLVSVGVTCGDNTNYPNRSQFQRQKKWSDNVEVTFEFLQSTPSTLFVDHPCVNKYKHKCCDEFCLTPVNKPSTCLRITTREYDSETQKWVTCAYPDIFRTDFDDLSQWKLEITTGHNTGSFELIPTLKLN